MFALVLYGTQWFLKKLSTKFKSFLSSDTELFYILIYAFAV